jgi:hypothetical protein
VRIGPTQTRAGAGRGHGGGGGRRDSRQTRRPGRRVGDAGALVRAGASGLERGGLGHRGARRVQDPGKPGSLPGSVAGRMRGLLGQRRTTGQGRRLRHSGAGGGLRRRVARQLLRGDGAAAVRNRRTAASVRHSLSNTLSSPDGNDHSWPHAPKAARATKF